MANGSGDSSGARTRAGSAGGADRVSYLDQAIWKQFADANAPSEFLQSWLALQCRLIGGVDRGVVVMAGGADGGFRPAAYWPEDGVSNDGLAKVAELALAEARGVIQGQAEADQPSPSGPVHAAYPFVVDDKVQGAIAIELRPRPRNRLRDVMQQLQWGAGWVEVIQRRIEIKADAARLERTASALDLVAAALERDRFKAACDSIVTELAIRLECDQVSIGFIRRRRAVVAAVSHAAQFGKRMNLIRDIGAAMDEAIDQQAIVAYPPRADWEYRITRVHQEFAATHADGTLLTVPLHNEGRFFGALMFERPAGVPFEEDEIDLCDSSAAIIGPILLEKQRNDRLVLIKLAESAVVQAKRLFGPRYFGRKLATAAAALVVGFFAIAEGNYKVTAPAVVEGEIQRSMVAPFDGYIATQHARAGDRVEKGSVLATLDDQDLVLERLRWTTKRRERRTEYDRARAARERALAKIFLAQIEEADAQIELLDAQIGRTEIRAPFDGVVILGDLSQSVGAAVQRGNELFQIAPLDRYRIILEVDESAVSDIAEGQQGTLLASSLPDAPLAYRVDRITPIAEAKDGRNYFRVEARLAEAAPRLRPGMGGVSKTRVEDRLLVAIWTKQLIDWLRLSAWRWLP